MMQSQLLLLKKNHNNPGFKKKKSIPKGLWPMEVGLRKIAKKHPSEKEDFLIKMKMFFLAVNEIFF